MAPGQMAYSQIDLQKVNSAVQYGNGRYRIAAPWNEQRPTLPNATTVTWLNHGCAASREWTTLSQGNVRRPLKHT